MNKGLLIIKEITLYSVLTSILFVQEQLLAFLPNIQLTFFLIGVYEMQLKSASQQITTQDQINDQTRMLAQQMADLNAIYARMIEAMSVNMK